MLQSVIIGLKECEGRGGGLKREWRPNNFLPRALQSGFLFESWVGGGGGGGGGGGEGRGSVGGGGNTTAKNRVRSSLILRTYLKCSQNADSLSGKENKTRMKA